MEPNQSDIEQILKAVESGRHAIDVTARSYIESLPGYAYSRHSPLTVTKYSRHLISDSRSLVKWMAERGVMLVEEINRDHLEQYKDFLLNALDPQTVRGYITAVRQLLLYAARMGWIAEELAGCVRLPQKQRNREIRTVPREVQKEVLDSEWGNNPFVICRNRLVVTLFLKRGLHPKEFPTLLEEHVHPYQDLAYLTVFGKKNVPRNIMLDELSMNALREYMIERAHLQRQRRIRDKHVFLSLCPRNGSYALSTGGVQAILYRIKGQLKLKGCLYDLSVLNAQGCRRSAVTADYELAEYSSIAHPEMSLCGMYGHGLGIAQKYYWKKSLANAYRLTKDSKLLNERLGSQGLPPDSGGRSASDRSFLDSALGI
jgi:site-specific recombinase XerD